jgi:hypothetical protein
MKTNNTNFTTSHLRAALASIRQTWLVVLLAVAALAVTAPAAPALFAAGQAGAGQPGQQLDAPPAEPAPSLTISPGVIMVQAQPGQGTTQDISISNLTPVEFTFELQAMDVAVRDGKRVFVPAGEMPGSIARTAVFSPSSVVVPPGSSATVQVTVTIPENPAMRAIVAVFRSNTKVQEPNVFAMTASLGALMTFNLSKTLQIEGSPLHFDGLSQGNNLVVSEWVTNTGNEPVIPKGVVAILNSTGGLVGKVPVEAMRLLPGERLEFKAEYPSTLHSGKYRALMTLEHDGTVLTTSSAFEIP